MLKAKIKGSSQKNYFHCQFKLAYSNSAIVQSPQPITVMRAWLNGAIHIIIIQSNLSGMLFRKISPSLFSCQCFSIRVHLSYYTIHLSHYTIHFQWNSLKNCLLMEMDQQSKFYGTSSLFLNCWCFAIFEFGHKTIWWK